jgi:uridylate kinase
MTTTLKYRRILLKLSGESLGGAAGSGFDPAVLRNLAADLAALHALGTQVAIVVGGGNFFRGMAAGLPGCDRVNADHIGMLATVMNALAVGHAVRATSVPVTVLSAFAVDGVVERYASPRANHLLDTGNLLVFGGGTGSPLFTTDSAAALRAIECNADVLIKATRVDGVYDRDPEKDPTAERLRNLSFDEVIERELKIMDATAFTLCREAALPIRVLDLNRAGSMKNAVLGLDEGTLIS